MWSGYLSHLAVSTVIDYLTNTSFPTAHFLVAPSEDTGLSQDTASPQKSSGTSL